MATDTKPKGAMAMKMTGKKLADAAKGKAGKGRVTMADLMERC